jgi:predicted lactoylglutathione lyase
MKQFWINLPVKDISKSKAFFAQLGFRFNTTHGNTPTSACMLLGDKDVVVMLFDEPTFKGYISNGAVAANSTEVLLSIDAESKEEVDELVAKAIAAGGTSNHKPSPMKDWMYGCVFTDLDGHRWNILHMDMSKMTTA